MMPDLEITGAWGYTRSDQAWWRDACIHDDEHDVVIDYAADGNLSAGADVSVTITWVNLGHWGFAPRLEIFSDMWGVFKHGRFRELTKFLADWSVSECLRTLSSSDNEMSIDQLCLWLDDHGYVDTTPREQGQ